MRRITDSAFSLGLWTRRGAGVENVLDRAVPNVAAGFGPCGDGNRLSNSVKKRQAMAGSGLEAAAVVGGSAVEGRGFVIMLDEFCSPASILGGASDSVHRQSGRCTRWRVHRDRYPQCFLSPGCGVLQYIDKVVDAGDTVALWRLVKEFHIFSTCLRCCLESGPYFLEPLVLAAICPCALRQSTDAFGRISSIFHVKSGLRAPRAVLTLEI